MTLNLSAIFEAEPIVIMPDPVVVPVNVEVDNPVEVSVDVPIINPWPVVEGTEHFSIWVHDEYGPWPEFIPGVHYDIRQPSRLQPLCAPQQRNQEQ